MAGDLLIRHVVPDDVPVLAESMRAADAAECRAGGREPIAALYESLAQSRAAWALELGGELAGLFGVVDGPRPSILAPAEYDIPWLLTGEQVDRFPVAFMRASRSVLAQLLAVHPVLCNLVDGRYSAALRWAKALGGELQPPLVVGVGQVPFHPVVWRAKPWATH